MDFSDNSFVARVENLARPVVATALPTPFKHGKIHFDSLLRLLQQQQKHADILVVSGTTAEPNMLTDDERKQVLSTVRLYTSLPVVAGVSANDTATAVQQACAAKALGASALLVSPPSFSKCTPDGYVKHILRIADESRLPIVLYNAPSRAGYALDPYIVRVLAERGVKYMKDAAADTALTVSATVNGIRCFCGNDSVFDKALHNGAIGTISVASNVAPLLVRAYAVAHTGDNNDTPNVEPQLAAIYNTLSALCAREVNPIAIKYLLYKAGIFDTYDVRLPLTKANRDTRQAIDEFWNDYGNTIQQLNSEESL